MKNSWTLLLALFMLFSCSSKHKEELETIKELQQRVDALQSTFENVDLEKVNLARETYKENISQIKKYFNEDTISMETGITLNRYKGIKKASKGLDDNLSDNQNDLTLLKQQLQNLSLDISNGVLEADSIKEYVNFEKGKVDELSDRIGSFIINCDYIIETHDSLAQKVKDLTNIF